MLDQRPWYLIHTKPRMEKQPKKNLDRQGYETYLPMIITRRRRSSYYIIGSIAEVISLGTVVPFIGGFNSIRKSIRDQIMITL